MSLKSRTLRQQRPLTEKGQELFEINVSKYTGVLHELKLQIDAVIGAAQEGVSTPDQIAKELDTYLDKYMKISEAFSEYLVTVRTDRSEIEKTTNSFILQSVISRVQTVLSNLQLPQDVKPLTVTENKGKDLPTESENRVNEKSSPAKSRSVKSKGSLGLKSKLSKLSSTSDLYVKQKAKLEEARVRLKYVKREAELLKERATVEAKIKILDSERQFEEFEQGLNAINECLEGEENASVVSELSDIRESRVRQFIEDAQKQPPAEVPYSQVTRDQRPTVEAESHVTKQQNICEDFSKFTVKKDMLLKRIHEFDDKPEFFGSWKRTFKDVVNELNLSPAEEVDLLVRFLGPDSKRSAVSIRSANFSDPDVARKRIWQRLNDRYSRPEMVESSIKQKLALFPKLTNKDTKRLYDLVDIVVEIESLKGKEQYKNLFAFYDASAGVNTIVTKLPYQLQEKWASEASKFKDTHQYAYPPFHVFVSFLERMARMKNDPSFAYESTPGPKTAKREHSVLVHKTDVPVTVSPSVEFKGPMCPLHKTNHTLNKCYSFRQKPLQERLDFIRSKGLCFKCCGQKRHLSKNCYAQVTCSICKADNHPTALHVDKGTQDERVIPKPPNQSNSDTLHEVTSTCTELCGNAGASKSCTKTVLVKVYPEGRPEESLLLYAIIDEQSNRSLARSAFFDHFGVSGPEIPYSLSSCSGSSTESGRRCSDFIVESLDSACRMTLPTLIECNQIPNIREEIPSPNSVRNQPHLRDLADLIPAVRTDAEILLLIGRDLLPAHHVLEQRLGPTDGPFAQKLRLVWVIIGNICLGTTHQPESISVMKTFTLKDGRTTLLKPCSSNIQIDENCIFAKTKEDDMPGLSIEDKQFIHLMEEKMYKGPDGCWTAPLPFRRNRQSLPNNRVQALRRAQLLDKNLRKNSEKMSHAVEFMKKILDNGHAEIAPTLNRDTERWYLPLFAVYHPKKPGNIRCVFDSSAKCDGISLNDVLLTGPDLINSLLGILLRFREHPIAITGDIEQMFYRFSVPVNHRKYLRFFWYRGNDPTLELIEYQMTRHVFGNSPSPAIATVGLRKTVSEADEDVKNFVLNNFYVDDALMSFDRSEDAVSVLARTQQTLRDVGNIRLHKISSNSLEVIKSFPQKDLAKEVTNVDLDMSQASLQRSLGVSWDIFNDVFTFRRCHINRLFTKRGILASINSLYDPVGFISPVTIRGKIIFQDVISTTAEWDQQLPKELSSRWKEWEDSLADLESLKIPRCYIHVFSSEIRRRELHVFSDASQRAIGAVVYLRGFDMNGGHLISFVHGKARVAPSHGHTIPRLELCAAVLAVTLKNTVVKHLSIPIDSITMYTDSRVVLGYINNEQRRFYVYVGNRLDMIRQSTTPDQWTYVSSEESPADIATRSIAASDIEGSSWIKGPSFLQMDDPKSLDFYPLVNPDNDKEVRPSVVISKTQCSRRQTENIGVHRFERFSDWYGLLRAIGRIKRLARSFKHNDGNKLIMSTLSSEELHEAERFVLKQVQQACFPKEVIALMEGREIHRTNPIIRLSPVLDRNGIMRVGGRLNNIPKSTCFAFNPIIVPKQTHITDLLVRYHHERVHHQGRHITEGKIRAAGYWIIGCKRKVTSFIQKCFICRKLRGRFGGQIMADLPEDRVTPSPPFTFVGVDTFGPWNIATRRTRGGQANQKRWAILFTCLVCRAVHIEVVEELSSSSFINALRRFIAIRGPVRQFRSDRGTNFVGAVEEIGINSVFIEDHAIKTFLNTNKTTWIFNPPHASHFGGAWERMIGMTRRILDAMLMNTSSKHLSHEVLTTFMAEVCSIINSRPIVPVSTDPEDSSVLTPSILLTQKTDILPENLPTLDVKDVYRAQWKHVIVLSKEFWNKWRQQYLSGLQGRPKWTKSEPNLKRGDIVLLKDRDINRNQWPIAIVEEVFPSVDSYVRKVKVRIARDRKCFIRPICELVPLIQN